MKKWPFLIVLASLLMACSSATDPIASLYDKRLSKVPIITGIWETSELDFDGSYGYSFGDPAYISSGNASNVISAFPNPAMVNSFITFSKLPQNATILIYEGTTAIRYQQEIGNYASANIKRLSLNPIRIIEKNSPSVFYKWDYTDNHGNIVNTGFYRAYIYDENGKEIQFIDLYLLVPHNCTGWKDVEGWLPKYWPIIRGVRINNSYINIDACTPPPIYF